MTNTTSSKKSDGKQESYVKITELTPEIYKGYHKYKVSIELPKKPNQEKLFELSELSSEKKSVWLKPDRYLEVFSAYLSEQVETYLDIYDTPYFVKNYKPNPELSAFHKVMEINDLEPTMIRFYIMTDESPIDAKNLENEITDRILEDFGTDYLGTFVRINKIKYFPHEHKTIKTTKIPLKPLIEKIEKESESR